MVIGIILDIVIFMLVIFYAYDYYKLRKMKSHINELISLCTRAISIAESMNNEVGKIKADILPHLLDKVNEIDRTYVTSKSLIKYAKVIKDNSVHCSRNAEKIKVIELEMKMLKRLIENEGNGRTEDDADTGGLVLQA